MSLNLGVKNNFSGDQYKSKDDYSTDANGDEEKKVGETGQYENMHNGGNNSDIELRFSEAEYINDKSDKTSLTGSRIDISEGNKKESEKSNLNSNRPSGKHIDPDRDGGYGDYAAVKGNDSVNSSPSMDEDNNNGRGTSEQQQQQNKESEPALNQYGETMDTEKQHQTNLETDLNSNSESPKNDCMFSK